MVCVRSTWSPAATRAAWWAVVATALPLAAVSARRSGSGGVSPAEERIFRRFNGAPDWIEAPAWIVMQAGSLAAVFATAAANTRLGRRRTAMWTAAVGTSVWIGAKAVKPLVGRGRPEELLDDVIVRGARQTGLGYPSGHAAVAMTLAWSGLANRCRAPSGLAIAGAGVVGATRLYVGAHLPLDVAGGLAMGTLVGCGANALRRGSASR